jgi:hypothetical protein
VNLTRGSAGEDTPCRVRIFGSGESSRLRSTTHKDGSGSASITTNVARVTSGQAMISQEAISSMSHLSPRSLPSPPLDRSS